MSTAQAFAARLNGREYLHEITGAEEAEAKSAGLVVVFGASDDLVELRGAIHDEIGAYDGTTFRVCPEGLLPRWPDEIEEGWSESEAADYFRRKALGVREIAAEWAPSEPNCSWAYRTEIPHATFDVMEDGELYCRGIVFSLADVAGPMTDPKPALPELPKPSFLVGHVSSGYDAEDMTAYADAARAPLVARVAELEGALRAIDARLRLCATVPATAAEAYDSYFQGIVSDALGKGAA